MAKIRHIAIKVEDQEKTAEFYKKTFGMTEAWRGPVREDGNRAIYLTDGYINMAVLPSRGGCETYVAAGSRFDKEARERDSGGFDAISHQLLIAMDESGYLLVEPDSHRIVQVIR